MDKRAHPRVAFEHFANILLNGRSIACVIRDFCPGGVLVELDALSLQGIDGATFGTSLEVVLDVKFQGKPQKINFFAYVRHQKRGAVGLQFHKIDTATLRILESLSGYQQSESSSSSSTNKTNVTPLGKVASQLISGYRRVILESLPVALERGMKVAGDKLLILLNESKDAWLRADYNLSLQMVETRGHWIAERVSQKILDELTKILEGETIQPLDTSFGDAGSKPGARVKLEVLQKNDFEDWLAVNMAVRSIETELGYDLSRVASILSQIGGQELDIQACPVGPDYILKTLSLAFNSLELPSSAQPLMFKIVGRILQNELRDIYAVMLSGAERFGVAAAPVSNANEFARAVVNERRQEGADSDHDVNADQRQPPGDVSPQASEDSPITQKERTSASSAKTPGSGRITNYFARYGQSTLVPLFEQARPSVVSASGAGAASEGSAIADASISAAMLQNLVQLGTAVNSGSLAQSSHRFADPTPAPEGERVDISTVLEAVSELQQHSRQIDEVNDGEALSLLSQVTELLTNSGKLNEETTLADSDRHLISITDQLFSSITSQKGLNEVIKKWLEKLKLSILKVILIDNTFFSNNEHPARVFINQLAKLGTIKRTSNKGLEKTLEHFTTRVINEYDGDNTVFEASLGEINQLVARQEMAFERNAERIARTYEGQQKLANARVTVAEEIARRIVNHKVPQILLDFLHEGGWRQFMVVTLLREGLESETYKEALTVIDMLIKWLAQNEGEEIETGFEIDLEAPTLFDMVDRELASSGQTGYQRILNRLKACVLDDEERDPLVLLTDYQWTGEGAEEIEKLRSSEGKKALSRWEKRATGLSVGDWVEFTVDDETQRMRLAWSGTNYYRFVFVSNQGLRDVDVSLEDFSIGIKEGRFRVLDEDEVPLVDQGLHNMVQSVYEDLAGQASCDPLTGVLNRQEYERYMSRAVADVVTNQLPYFIAYVDIDQFRVVNNSYGHLAGDHMLKHVSRLLSENISKEVICGRLGGNEFGLIFKGLEHDVVMTRLDKMRQLVMDSPFTWENNKLNATVSIGLAEVNRKSDNVDSVMRKAYLACESAKDHGRNRIVEYALHDKDQARQDEMMLWVKRIENALDDFLVLRCQEIRPIREADNKSHYEILLGLKDEEGNLLPPIALIEAAEHYDRMTRIDRWVVNKALTWMQNNPQIVDKIDGLSINLSGTSIGDEDFLDYVLAQLDQISVPKEKICFEVTETAAITCLTEAIEFISILKKRGCKFALDDFGTGLSSYAYIQKMPVDYLKIDGVFIRNITNNQKDEALVRSINDLAHFMGMKTTAEYVENDDIFHLLRDIGVDKAQGFGVHKPMLLENLT